MNKKNTKLVIQFLSPLILVVSMFLILPYILMVLDSFQGKEIGFTVSNYITALTNKFYLNAIVNSLKISILSSAIGMTIALICAYAITQFHSTQQNKIITILNMTSNYSGVPLALGYILLLGNTGLFIMLSKHNGWSTLSEFNVYSWVGLIICYVYFQIPLGIMLVYPAFLGIRKEWQESAALLGANELQFWMKIGMPILMPSMIGTLSILFANAMSAYGTAIALVGKNYNLLTIRIGSMVVGEMMPNYELASALAVILGGLNMALMATNERVSKFIRSGSR
ncbi:ABC transporter permease [Clostridiaceae bacterium 35-E11]